MMGANCEVSRPFSTTWYEVPRPYLAPLLFEFTKHPPSPELPFPHRNSISTTTAEEANSNTTSMVKKSAACVKTATPAMSK